MTLHSRVCFLYNWYNTKYFQIWTSYQWNFWILVSTLPNDHIYFAVAKKGTKKDEDDSRSKGGGTRNKKKERHESLAVRLTDLMYLHCSFPKTANLGVIRIWFDATKAV